jgi:hypothetical protein
VITSCALLHPQAAISSIIDPPHAMHKFASGIGIKLLIHFENGLLYLKSRQIFLKNTAIYTSFYRFSQEIKLSFVVMNVVKFIG